MAISWSEAEVGNCIFIWGTKSVAAPGLTIILLWTLFNKTASHTKVLGPLNKVMLSV